MNDTDAGADAGDGRWMTYGELAVARQIGRRAAIRLAQRHRLKRMPGNDGMARVWVPTDMASSSPHRPTPPVTDTDDSSDDTPADVATPFHAKALAALEDALMAANQRAEEAQALADRLIALLADAERVLKDERGRGERAEAGLADERSRADGLRDRLIGAQAELSLAQAATERAQAEAQAAQDAAEDLREAEEARKARGRLRRAWDGWRGK
jgi:hypothetical protein